MKWGFSQRSNNYFLCCKEGLKTYLNKNRSEKDRGFDAFLPF